MLPWLKEPVATVYIRSKLPSTRHQSFLSLCINSAAVIRRVDCMGSRGKATESNTKLIKEVNKVRFLPQGALAALPPAQQKTWATARKDANMALKKIEKTFSVSQSLIQLGANSLEHPTQIYEQLSKTENRGREYPQSRRIPHTLVPSTR